MSSFNIHDYEQEFYKTIQDQYNKGFINEAQFLLLIHKINIHVSKIIMHRDDILIEIYDVLD